LSGGAATPVGARTGSLAASRVATVRRPLAVILAVLVFALGALGPGHFASEFVLRLGVEGLLLGMLALSVAFLMQQAGLVALGAASVYGGVGYLFAITMSEWDMSPTAALFAAFVIVIVYAVILGALIVRTNPLAFMMLTLAAGEMVSHGVMLEGLRDYTSGADGLVVKFEGAIFGLQAADFASASLFWPIAWSAAWVLGLAVFATGRSRFGAILRAVRENEERMRFSGFGTYLPRLVAFVFVNGLAAVAGLLHVLNSQFVSPESLGLSVSTNALVASLIGGAAGSIGPIAGGLFFAFAQDEFGARGFTQLLTGAAIVVFIVLFPRGIVGGLIEAARRRTYLAPKRGEAP
jgi:branched-chain amino acid transport system permease protein